MFNKFGTYMLMKVIFSYIYRELNFCLYALANLGLTLNDYTNCNSISAQISEYSVGNKFGLSNFRFLNF